MKEVYLPVTKMEKFFELDRGEMIKGEKVVMWDREGKPYSYAVYHPPLNRLILKESSN